MAKLAKKIHRTIICQFSSPVTKCKLFKKNISSAKFSMNNGVWLDKVLVV